MDEIKPGRLHRRDVLHDLGVLGVLALAAATGANRPVHSISRPSQSHKEQTDMTHVVLLGDSSLDNQAYVLRGQAVLDHLRRVALKDWQVTLLAVDGSRTGGVARQLAQVPAGATHLVLSIGGNDA